jgi:hypothetical protein
MGAESTGKELALDVDADLADDVRVQRRQW